MLYRRYFVICIIPVSLCNLPSTGKEKWSFTETMLIAIILSGLDTQEQQIFKTMKVTLRSRPDYTSRDRVLSQTREALEATGLRKTKWNKVRAPVPVLVCSLPVTIPPWQLRSSFFHSPKPKLSVPFNQFYKADCASL